MRFSGSTRGAGLTAVQALPVAARLLQWLEANAPEVGQKITVIDLCSGVGYMSILVSELLQGACRQCVWASG